MPANGWSSRFGSLFRSVLMAIARSFPSTVESRNPCITAFGDRGGRLLYGTVQLLLRVRMFWQQLGNGLEPEQQTVKANSGL
jgi:hypothetical protein